MIMNGDYQQTAVLKVDGLNKQYVKGVPINNNVSISVKEGEIFGLLGPNGAGKTTLVNQIIGLVRPCSGVIEIDGVNVITNPDFARQACSFQAQTQVPIAGLTAIQAIELVGMVRGGSTRYVRQRTKELIDSLEIGEWANKTGETFSGGVRRLVAYCMAAVVPGRIVILDEPTNDVDPLRRRLLWKQVQELSVLGSTVLLVTHNVLEAERTVDRLAIMDKGKIIASGRPAQLKETDGQNMRLDLMLEPEAEVPISADFLHQVLVNSRRLIARLNDSNVAQAIEWAQTLKEKNIVEEYSIGPSTLEDVYVRMVGHLDVLGTVKKEAENVTASA